MLKIFALLILSVPFRTMAQGPTPGWHLGVNPLSLTEPQTSVGPAFERRFSPTTGLWAEASYLFYNAYLNVDRKKFQGFRLILQPRLYTNRRRNFFITPEVRLKSFGYTVPGTFINNGAADTLFNFRHKVSQFLIGGAFVVGKQFILNRSNGFILELTAGVGGRHRIVNRKNIPQGYDYFEPRRAFGLSPDYESDNVGGPYFPLGIRFMWRIGN